MGSEPVTTTYEGATIRSDASRPVKVVHITTIDKSLRYLLLNQLLSIHQEGYQVVTMSGPGPDVEILEEVGLPHIAVPMVRSSSLTPFADLRMLWHLYKVMRREKFTIVHTHNAKPDLFGPIAARLAGVPIVMSTLHGFYFHEHMPTFWRRFYMLLAKIGAYCSDVILSQNEEDIQTAIAEGICPPEKIQFLGNGIDLSQFDRAQLDEAVLVQKREVLGLTKQSPVVGFVGRLVAEKGILELLEAMQVVHKRIPKARLLIVGPIDTFKQDALTPEVATRYDLEEVCIFAGMRHDMPDLYALMDVFVLPSHREGFPRAGMEAATMGVPAVVTDIRGCRSVVQHGVNGLRVPLGDTRALADAMISLLEDPEKASQMGEAGQKIARTAFDEQRVFERVKGAYARLLKEKNIATLNSHS